MDKESLKSQYGYCLIPKGTYLFRQGEHENRNVLFFALHPIWAETLHDCENLNIQLWEVKKDFEVLFMIDYIGYVHIEDPILDIYNSLTKEAFKSINYIVLKSREFNRRKVLFEKLNENGIYGWLSSINGYSSLEICLFPDTSINDFVQLIRQSEDIATKYRSYNSLSTIEIYPSCDFIEKTKKKLQERKNGPIYKSSSKYSILHKLLDKGIINKELLK